MELLCPLFLLRKLTLEEIAEDSVSRLITLTSFSALGSYEHSLITGSSLKTSKRLDRLTQCQGRVVTPDGSLGREEHSLVGVKGDSI